MTTRALAFEAVSVRHRDLLACDSISLRAAPGEISVLMGENGSGKSTLLSAAAGLLPLSAGRILAGDVPLVPTRSGLAAWRRHVGFVMHDPDDQLLGATVCEDVAFGPHNLGLPDREIARRVDAALAALDLEEQHDAAPHELSHGQKLRTAIAGALALEPQILLLDEPTSGLDHDATQLLVTLLTHLRETGRTIVLSTHDVEFAWRVADRVTVLQRGRVLVSGSRAKILGSAAACQRAGVAVPLAVALQSETARPDRPLRDRDDTDDLTTKRRSIASVLVCNGCCCGRTEKGHPAIPLDWLKAEFKRRKLLHRVHLTVTGCLGPCDVSNVVGILTPEGTLFLGGLDSTAHYEALVDWADASWQIGTALPLPPLLAAARFERLTSPAATPLP